MIYLGHMEILGKLFGSSARVKILRLFLYHPEHTFDAQDVMGRSKISLNILRKEMSILERIGFLKKKAYVKEYAVKNKKTLTLSYRKKKTQGWFLNQQFSLNKPLRYLLIDSELVKTRELPKRFMKAGKIKLFILSGIFMHDDARSLDMLIVGDKLKKHTIDSAVAVLEAEIGKELRYAVFDSEEFLYRLKMYDKLIRDTFDHPHESIINKFKISDIF